MLFSGKNPLGIAVDLTVELHSLISVDKRDNWFIVKLKVLVMISLVFFEISKEISSARSNVIHTYTAEFDN